MKTYKAFKRPRGPDGKFIEGDRVPVYGVQAISLDTLISRVAVVLCYSGTPLTISEVHHRYEDKFYSEVKTRRDDIRRALHVLEKRGIVKRERVGSKVYFRNPSIPATGPKPKKFTVRFLREVTEFVDLEVVAGNAEQAEDKAWNTYFNEALDLKWQDCDGNDYETYLGSVFDENFNEIKS